MFRLHLESRRAQSPAFHLDEAAWSIASTRHPELAKSIDVSFGWDGEVLNQALASADAIIASRFDRQAVNAAPRLKWIHTTGAGVDHLIPLTDFRADLLLSNSSGIHSDKAGESALMALLMLNAGIPDVIANQRKHVWKSLLTTPIRGKRLVLIGFGDIGKAVGRMARQIGIEVIAVTRSGASRPEVPNVPVVPTSMLDELLPSADFVVVTAPLTPETRNLMNAHRLSLLPAHAGLVNMARAPLVDYGALVHLLREGRLAGAVLDVFEGEPLDASSVYWDVPRLIVTPHITCDAPDYNQRVLDLWFENFGRFLSGTPLLNQVNRSLGY
jgi:phosphoglycerate dehydrogenase-like enzyme